MTADPLLLEATRIIREKQAEYNEALCNTVFTQLYEVGKLQGRIQGLAVAMQSIDDAARAMYEES